MFAILKILGSALIVLALSGGLYINSQRAAIIEKALTTAEETASKLLGVPVKIGSVDIDNVNIIHFDKESDITIHDLEIYDKQDELIARADVTTVDFNLKLLLLAVRDDKDQILAALDEIKINGATLNLKKRDEKSWNFQDIKLESERPCLPP